MRKQFFTRLLFSFMMVSIVPIILLGVFTTLISVGVSMNQLKRQVDATAERASDTIGQLINDFQQRLVLFCADQELQTILSSTSREDSSRQQLSQKIYLMLAGRVTQFEMHVVSKDGSLTVSTTTLSPLYDPSQFSEWGLLRNIGAQEKALVYPNRFINATGKEIAASIGSKIVDASSGRILGYAIIDIPYQTIALVLEAVASELPVSYSIINDQQYLMYDDLGIGEGFPFVAATYRTSVPATETKAYLQQINGQRFMISSASLLDLDLRIISAVPIGLVLNSNSYITVITLILAFIALVLCLIFSWVVAKSISQPISHIAQVMGQVEKGDLRLRAAVESRDEIGLLSEGLNHMIENLDTLFSSNLEKQDRLRIAEIKHLQAQINPHFLYNTLDSIRYLAKLGMNEEITLAVSRLGILLKSSMQDNGDIETIGDTILIIRSYLDIQQIMYPDKFDFLVEIDESLNKYLIPKLILQPLVENAIIHGMAMMSKRCSLWIKAKPVGKDCVFEISDNGSGIEESVLAALQSHDMQVSEGESIGLHNVNRRIQLYFGKDHGLEIVSKAGAGTQITLVLPLVQDNGWFLRNKVCGVDSCIG